MKHLMPTLTTLSFAIAISASFIPVSMGHASQEDKKSKNQELIKVKSEKKRISDEKAVKLAIKAVKKNRLFGGSIIQYSETRVKQYGSNLRVTFFRHLPSGVRGSEKVYSVELDAYTGKFVRFLGY